MAAVLVIVGLTTFWYAWLIVRSALPSAARRGRPRRRGVGFLAAGMLFSAASTLAAGLAKVFAAPDATLMEVPLPAELPLIGLFLTVGAFVLGLLLMPAAAATFVGRLRRMLDGVGIGVWAFVVAWLLIFSSVGLRGASLTAVLLACVAVSAASVGTARAMQYQRAAIVCGAGGVVSMIGLTGLVVALDYDAPRGWGLAAAALLLAGSLMTWYGLRATEGTPHPPEPADGDGSFSGYPMLALPVAGAVVAGAYHLAQQRYFDSTTIMLGLIAVCILALRETLAVIDVRRYARRLAAREEHFRSLVAGSTDVTLVLDEQLVVRWQAPAAARQFGLSDQDVVGRSLLARVHPDDTDAVAGCLEAVLAGAGAEHPTLVEARLRDGFGAWRETEWSIGDQRAVPAVRALVVHVRDITERKELERTLHRAAFVDQLTGLPNRRELHRTLAARTEPGALVAVGLGGLTGVTQVHGHETGDAVLMEAARRLRDAVKDGELPVRLDGDKFAVFTGGGAVRAQLLATRLLAALNRPYPVPDAVARLSAGAGLADVGADVDANEALRRAEVALRRARGRAGDGAVEWYDTAMEEVVRRRLTIEQELPGAAGRGELDVLYQPIVDLPLRRPVGVEALLCWRHPRLGTLKAAEFVPVAEELGELGEIMQWLLQRVCRQLSGWLHGGWELWLSVDVSRALLGDPAFVGTVAAALDAYLLPPSAVVVELAEAGLTGGPDSHAVVTHLVQLRTRGVRAALDQFGTRATSLSQLRLLPLDMIKLDRQLLRDASGGAGAIVDAVMNLAQQLGVEVVVQGLEIAADLDAAVAAGCRYGQGDLLCRPSLPEYLEAYLESHRASPLQ